jgi:hypothetical protein
MAQRRFDAPERQSLTSCGVKCRDAAGQRQEMNFDKSGKPVMSKVDDTWVMRNISTPLRAAPKRDNPDMYEVLSEDVETALASGRYALVLKGQACDFNVAGSIPDPKQCLERMAATNGRFYLECQKHLGLADDPLVGRWLVS